MIGYIDVWKKYAKFSGRSRRQEYWSFALLHSIILVVLGLIGGVWSDDSDAPLRAVAIPYVLYDLAAIIPWLAVLVRRLHDTGRSGWWALIGLVPLAGFVTLLVFTATDSQASANKWGTNPKEMDWDYYPR